MAVSSTETPAAAGRARIAGRTLRQDRWWIQPAVTVTVLVGFIAYATWAAFVNKDYYAAPYISPFYSPCIASVCTKYLATGDHLAGGAPSVGIIGTWWRWSPALWILVFPLGFRTTCYYYRKAYYRSFWASPPACAVAEPHARYTGETRFPLIGQNVHRYFFYAGLVFNAILTYDAVVSFRQVVGGHLQWGHMGLGTLVLVVNATLLWLYSASCHSCRHVVGGRLRNFSTHPLRYKAWTLVSKLNERHQALAWASLLFVAFTDLYVRLVASGTIHDPRFF